MHAWCPWRPEDSISLQNGSFRCTATSGLGIESGSSERTAIAPPCGALYLAPIKATFHLGKVLENFSFVWIIMFWFKAKEIYTLRVDLRYLLLKVPSFLHGAVNELCSENCKRKPFLSLTLFFCQCIPKKTFSRVNVVWCDLLTT